MLFFVDVNDGQKQKTSTLKSTFLFSLPPPKKK